MAIFTVTNNNDSGLGSLRQAIADANAAIGLDTIEFDNSLSGETITLTSGELQITDDLNISGFGADFLTISGNNASGVFLVDNGDFDNVIDVVIDGLTITEGNSDDGGGIRNRETLTVLNSNISDNMGTGITNAGTFTTSPSYISNLTVENSIISDNTSNGIFGSYSNLNVSNSIISNNLAGIDNGNGNGEITQSTISGNTNVGLRFGVGSLIITNSDILDNTGPGISGSRFDFQMDNSTISGNTTTGDGGAVSIFNAVGTISNSTITNNVADRDGDGNGNGGAIGGLPVFAIVFSNTIIAGNIDNSPAGSEQHPDISSTLINAFRSNGYNFIGDVTGFTNFDPANFPTDLFGTSANPLGLSNIIEGTTNNDDLAGTSGINRIEGGDGNDTLRGRGSMDQLLGEVGDDSLLGGTGDDILGGGDGNDTLNGGTGNDQLLGDADNDRLVGGDGNDFLDGGIGADILLGQGDNDYLVGDDGNDTLNGGNGDDQLFGEGDNDRLIGGDGNDTLSGGLGRDLLTGGAGSDRFMLVSGVTSDRDIIRDYQDGIDRIIFTGDLSFNDLTISQSNTNTQIRETATNQILAVLNNTDANNIDQSDFEFGAGDNGIRVEVEDYVNYFDTTTGNTGGEYRSDDVDIEVTTDIGGGFNVGYIEEGEWLTYNAVIPENGLYQVVARVASNTTDGRVHNFDVSIDGQSTSLGFDATGGWQSWTDVIGDNLNLSAGSHELRLDMGSSGFNINYVDLVPVDI